MDQGLPEEVFEEDVRQEGAAQPVAEETSAEYLRRWNRLVSTTNWEKGRIIQQWRQALVESGAPVQSYSDEAWARQVGNVSGQHVGRLRRVYERFHETFEQYTGLFWSHFQAALDWHDAEMWLEGAMQNDWSVSQMRRQRWEADGAPAEAEPRDQDVVMEEMDEDVDPTEDSDRGSIRDSSAVVQPAEGEETDEEDESDDAAESVEAVPFDVDRPDTSTPIRPFEHLPALPDDLADALESLKLAIVSHRLTRWSDVPREHVLAALDALRQLAQAPIEA